MKELFQEGRKPLPENLIIMLRIDLPGFHPLILGSQLVEDY